MAQNKFINNDDQYYNQNNQYNGQNNNSYYNQNQNQNPYYNQNNNSLGNHNNNDKKKKINFKFDKKIIIGAGIILAVIIAIILFVLLNNEKKESDTGQTDKPEVEEKEENKKDEEKNETTNEEKELDINSDLVRGLYNKYHTSQNILTSVDSLKFEKNIYDYGQTVFEVKNLKNISASLANYIYKNNLSKFESKIKKDINGRYLEVEDIEPILKESVYDLFGDNLTFSKKLFDGCNEFSYFENGNKYRLDPQCGDTSALTAYYDIYKATEDNNYLYLYEYYRDGVPEQFSDVKCDEKDYKCMLSNIGNNLKYKWTFNKDNNGNYHLLKIEKIG